jgi:transcriptional repressor NrdR
MVDAIAGKLIAMQQREVGSEQIGELAMAVLQEVDEVAYVRFASIYRRFKRVDQFINELQNLSGRKPRHPALLPEE